MIKTIFTRNLPQKKVFVVREFAAPVLRVWQAWTDPELLDQWWAPEPWKAVTKSMDFRPGGFWLYYMKGPEGEQSYARADYKAILPQKSYESIDAFCDENGALNTDFPRMDWKTQFSATPAGTKVEIEITYASEADLLKIAELGFEEGFTMAHGNLDRLLAK
jgi:uncharacterized protein YndB with AHSA1/START domain